MRTFDRCALGISAAAALLTGCGGSQPPIGEGAMPQRRTVAAQHGPGGSWMLSEAKKEDLLYVSSASSGDVFIYSYRKRRQVGALHGLNARGLCVDAEGDVYVANTYPPKVLEYAHGGTQPIKELTGAGNEPGACSVDPTTGNLAVTNFSGPNFIAIYAHASGTPKLYQRSDLAYMFYCTYDGLGNLFSDGQSNARISGLYKNRFLELAKDSERIVRVHSMRGDDGGIQWDGRYVAVGSYASLDEFMIDHRDGTLEKSTPLLGPEAPYNQFWIAGDTVVVTEGSPFGKVEYFVYPAGGYAAASIDVDDAYGVTVSVARSR